MKLSKKEIQKISDLVRLELKDGEKEKYSHDLTSILDYVEKLNEVDTSRVKLDTGELENVYDEDRAKGCELSQKDLLKNAPETKDGFIKVKQVLE